MQCSNRRRNRIKINAEVLTDSVEQLDKYTHNIQFTADKQIYQSKKQEYTYINEI